jgi:hypothetical protein
MSPETALTQLLQSSGARLVRRREKHVVSIVERTNLCHRIHTE